MCPEQILFGASALPEPDREWLAAVERLPIESVWHGGHVVLNKGSGGEVVTRLALMTAWTERVRVGTAIVLLPLYQPVILAKQLADLDSHSGGRLAVGVGVGGEFPHEFDALGVPVAERGARADESIRILRALWGGDPVTHHGRFFDLDGVQLRAVTPSGAAGPRMQTGGPPLLVAGRKPPAMRRAARLGDGWMPYLYSANAYARSVHAIREEAARAGRDLAGFEWMLSLKCCIRADGEQARADAAKFLGYAYGEKPTGMFDRIVPAGSPEEVAPLFQQFVDAGARTIILSPATYENTLEVVELAAKEVLPRLAVPDVAPAALT